MPLKRKLSQEPKRTYVDTSNIQEMVAYLQTKQRRRYNGRKRLEQNVYEAAHERVRHAYELFDTIAVSFSGGKDSTACLNITLNVARELGKLPLEVVFYDEEAIPYQTEEYVRRVAENPDIHLRWFCLPVKHRNACSRSSPWWSPWDLACPHLWVRSLPQEAIQQLDGFETGGEPRDRLTIPESNGLLFPPERYGTVGLIMGIRAQESVIRAQAVSNRLQDNYIVLYDDETDKKNLWKVYPIYDWRIEDVWTAPAKYGWDYNEAYDVMEQAGMSIHQQRCSPAYGEEPMQGFDRYKTCFPEIWDRMSLRVPGANAALLYAKTELWGYKEKLQKPEDQSWQQFIANAIEKFPEADRELVAEQVGWLIDNHYRKTLDPILSYVPHPLTGVCWERIANIATRGDFKGRRTSMITKKGASDVSYAKHWQAYCAAREEEGL